MNIKKSPIIFSTEMVRAILEGKKTQMRKIESLYKVNQYPNDYICFFNPLCNGFDFWDAYYIDEILYFRIKCPYGKVGDKLWIRKREDGSFAWEEKDAFIWLEITNVKVERLQKINEENVETEGLRLSQFKDLWNKTNKRYPWESNPWVWVIEFKKI